MRQSFSHLIKIENNRAVTPADHGRFLHALRLGLLLALQDLKILTEQQLRLAAVELGENG